jgi:hypothetical protein
VTGEEVEGSVMAPSSSQEELPLPPSFDNELMFDELLDQINIENPALHEDMQIKLMNKGNSVAGQ